MVKRSPIVSSFEDGRAPGVFPVRNGHLWEQAFTENGNGKQGGRKWQWNRKLPRWQSGKTTKMMKWRKVNQGGAGAAVVSEGAAAGVLQREVIKRVCVL